MQGTRRAALHPHQDIPDHTNTSLQPLRVGGREDRWKAASDQRVHYTQNNLTAPRHLQVQPFPCLQHPQGTSPINLNPTDLRTARKTLSSASEPRKLSVGAPSGSVPQRRTGGPRLLPSFWLPQHQPLVDCQPSVPIIITWVVLFRGGHHPGAGAELAQSRARVNGAWSPLCAASLTGNHLKHAGK